MKQIGIIIVVLFMSIESFAGSKDKFIKAVKAQCGKTDKEAKKLAKPGRAGNVFKYNTCTSGTVAVDDCILQCNDKSSSISD